MNDYIENIIVDMKKAKKVYGQESLSVEEVLNLPTLKGYNILAGVAGLQKRCKHITILETPNGISWLQGGEFLVTSGYAFLHYDEYKKNMLIDANIKEVSAIAIKTNRFFGDVSQEMINQANEFKIPLIQIPYEVVYTETISSFYDMLFYRKNEYIIRLNDIYQRLMNLSFENRDIDGIIYSLSNIANVNVYLFDSLFNPISNNIINARILSKISKLKPFYKEGLPIIIDIRSHTVNFKLDGLFISIYPITRDNNTLAYLYIVNDTEIDKLAQSSIEYGISIISMKLERNKSERLVQTRFNKTLAEIMLNNKELPDEFYQNVERDLGWDDKGCIIGLCIRIHAVIDSDFEGYKNDIYNGINNIIGEYNYLSTNKKIDVFVFIKIYSDDYLENIIAQLQYYLNSFDSQFVVSIGVSGQYMDIKSIRYLYDEAYLAVLFSNKDIVYFKSLDTIKLLYPLKEGKEIQEYFNRTIKKLIKYDEDNGTNLMETLELYFKYNLKKTIVAGKLYIHIETLRYRLNRIEAITGYSLDDSEGLFALQMGIKLKRLIKL